MTDFNELVRAAGKRRETEAEAPPSPPVTIEPPDDVAPGALALTLTEAAARQGVHRRTVRGWVRDGRLPARITPGGHYRILAGDLDRLPLATDDFAAAVGVCRRTVVRWCEAGKLAARKVGGEWLIDCGEVARVGARPAARLRGKA